MARNAVLYRRFRGLLLTIFCYLLNGLVFIGLSQTWFSLLDNTSLFFLFT